VLARSSLRHFTRHPWQGTLAVVGIALGVAVVVAVDLATGSARLAFALSSQAVFGRTTHQVVAGSEGLPDSVYTTLRVALDVEAAPVVDVRGVLRAGDARRSVRLLGVDPFAEAPFRSYLDATTSDLDLSVLLTQPGAVLLTAETAAVLGVAVGDTLGLAAGAGEHRARVIGLLRPGDALSQRALADIVLCDVAVAQELSGRVGRLDRIDLIMPADSSGERMLRAVRAALPGAAVVTTAARAGATAGMTRAFELNLTAFALITLVFGALLIYDTMTFSVVQRRELIGLLRAVGVTRGEVLRLFLSEALFLGALATALGLLLGMALGGALIRLVVRTINDLYFTVSVSRVALAPAALVKGVLLGIGATLLAALSPVLEATSTPPRQVLARSMLEAKTQRNVTRAALGGAALLAAGAALVLAPGRSLLLSFSSLFAVVLAASLLAPFAAVLLMRAIRPLAAALFGRIGSMAVRGVASAMSRTGPAVAALMVAIAVGAAVATMVSSFRGSVVDWLDASIQADIYVSAAGGGNRGGGTLPAEVIAQVASAAGLDGVTTYHEVFLPFRGGDLRTVAVALFARHRASFTFLEGEPAAVWPAFAGGAVLVSESFRYRQGLGVGDSVLLATERGPHAFPIAAVFRDYATEFGVVFMDRGVYDRYWSDREVSSLALWLRPDAAADSVMAALRSRIAAPDVIFRSNRGLHEATLQVFDRTFVITRVLRSLALIVAFVGMLSSLMALQLERSREMAVLRALGLSPGQVWGLVTAETGLLGLAAGLLALPVSVVLAWLLIHVVNRRSFGWSIDLQVDTPGLLQALALALLAALLAGAFPAHRMSRTSPAAALRAE
jgi:putative ABC transport system permease protein